MDQRYSWGHIAMYALITTFFMIVITAGCSGLTSKNAESDTLPAVSPTPEYLVLFAPITISQREYNLSISSSLTMVRGIAISFWANKMDLSGENCNWEVISQRVSLYVDGKKMSNDTLIGGADGELGCGLFRASWAPVLTVGCYEAKFQLVTDLDKVLEYAWSFVIEK